MVKVDIKNAFGTISRQAIMHGISLYAPIFARWAACSLRPTSVFYGELALEITTGVQQGDPLAPVFFSPLGLHPVITEVRDECVVFRRRPHHPYHRPRAQQHPIAEVERLVTLSGPKRLCLKVLQLLKLSFANIGLAVNMLKCKFMAPR